MDKFQLLLVAFLPIIIAYGPIVQMRLRCKDLSPTDLSILDPMEQEGKADWRGREKEGLGAGQYSV